MCNLQNIKLRFIHSSTTFSRNIPQGSLPNWSYVLQILPDFVKSHLDWWLPTYHSFPFSPMPTLLTYPFIPSIVGLLATASFHPPVRWCDAMWSSPKCNVTWSLRHFRWKSQANAQVLYFVPSDDWPDLHRFVHKSSAPSSVWILAFVILNLVNQTNLPI